MSTGKTHATSSLFLAAGFSVGAMISGDPKLFICSAGSLFGIICSPDQDVDSGNISNSIVRKKVGWFGERLWRWFWRGYSSSFKHGQFASHFPVWSTAIRLLYIFFWLILIPHTAWKLLLSPHWELSYVLSWYLNIMFDMYFFYGLASSDFIHYVLDKMTRNAS